VVSIYDKPNFNGHEPEFYSTQSKPVKYGKFAKWIEEGKFSKLIVIVSILTMLAYTATVLFFSWHDKFVPDSLTYSFFGAFAVELSALAGIKVKERQNFDRRF